MRETFHSPPDRRALRAFPPDRLAREVLALVERRFAASVEGFIRQILGWREYVRGIQWLHMPGWWRS